MHAIHRLLDYVSSETLHIDWYVLAGLMVVCTLIAGWAVRRL
jgi:hypothetical protein